MTQLMPLCNVQLLLTGKPTVPLTKDISFFPSFNLMSASKVNGYFP